MDGLKQRIIGALVLVSLAVIFVPMIFDEPHSERTTTSIQIPEEPPFPAVDVGDGSSAKGSSDQTDVPPPSSDSSLATEVPASSGAGTAQTPQYRLIERSDDSAPAGGATDEPPARQDVAVPEPAPATEEPAVASTAPTKAPANDSDNEEFSGSLEGAWVVQLGSFGNPDNARRLRDKAREQGYSAHLQEVTRGDVKLVRVFSGPYADRQQAEGAKGRIDKAFGLKSLVTQGEN
ncbi:SPOR domain-containing protein [Marinobacter sp. C2H3]|uniref:SPOR domain-containing protein n=1 Tax=Marinobacter sp. C2H3 TaxID=3119003 RepID=UPI00300F74E2